MTTCTLCNNRPVTSNPEPLCKAHQTAYWQSLLWTHQQRERLADQVKYCEAYQPEDERRERREMRLKQAKQVRLQQD